jgi:hypothetical protein
MIALGIAGLLLSRHLEGPGEAFLRAHGANVSFSFAAFFLVSFFGRTWPPLRRGAVSAGVAYAGVAGQEIAQAFGIYPGVFDPLDLLFDAAGVGIAWLIAALAARRHPAKP